MGYPTISQFDKNFIARTIENLNGDVKNTYTHLVNSLLGLVILPRQWNVLGKRTPEFFNYKVIDCIDLLFLSEVTTFSDEKSVSHEISKLEFRGKEYEEITLKDVIDKLRHSIAHQSIRPTQEEDKWRGIIFRSYPNDLIAAQWGDNYSLQLYLTESELRKLVLFIAERYCTET
jgi:hypothetical protein